MLDVCSFSAFLGNALLKKEIGLFLFSQTFHLVRKILINFSPFSLNSLWWCGNCKCRRETCDSKKKLHQVFVNLSLIISTELEKKLPADDAEPEIMPAWLLKRAIYSKPSLSMAPKCFHVKLRGDCQFSWGIERVCQWEHVIIWLTVNVIQVLLFSCPQKADYTLCYLHWKTQQISSFEAPVHHMCLQCCI